MGNSPGGLRLLGNGNYSYDIKLGKAAIIRLKMGRLQEEENSLSTSQTWQLTYSVDGVTSTLSIIKTTNHKLYKPIEEILHVRIEDYLPEANNWHIKEKNAAALPPQATESFFVTVRKDDEKGTSLLNVSLHQTCKYSEEKKFKRRRQRSTTGTSFDAYGCGTRTGVFVIEEKNRSNENLPYMVTVRHYYVNSGSTGKFRGSGVDIGFSVVVKIGVVNGQLDFSVEGPEEHPTSALFYMIEEVCRTGTWKPSACPHCNNIQSQQRRLLLSESEDSDTNLPTPPSHAGQQNASNKGRFKGDGIGSMIRAKNVNFNKWWT
ncbi:hypothetical protein LR48_Vigan10g011900 [Vigna angularis]|uniref:Uncharacterized protein n=2 Tax=Phaseolus angularis TaxID=3914 RepID=A0A0L9VH28_PHAAN|nr:uncharacterized protein LOC108345117 [Vigna angularis]KAG2385293.1 uncharacterized protein HKW66_Vig0123850 [Vigna angularis]KOM54227.1 hypothetical protein LR48_Vigan10g011900 [Vigna angularis]BAU02893.1 hypothetical protein VIGAN_11248900 [Vigna angularis var. angularis]